MDFQAKVAELQAACAAVDLRNAGALRLCLQDALRAGVPPTHPVVLEAKGHLDRLATKTVLPPLSDPRWKPVPGREHDYDGIVERSQDPRLPEL